MKSVYLPEHDCFVRYFVIDGSGPAHVYLAPLICPVTATLLEVATHPRLRDRSAILVDYLGCGASDRPSSFSHSMADHAATVAAILDAEGIRRATIVGHSMGGTVGVQLAIARPDLVGTLVLGESNLHPGGGDGTRYIASFTTDEYVVRIAPAEVTALRARAVGGDGLASAMLAMRSIGSDPRAVHAASVDLVGLDPSLFDAFVGLPVSRAFIYGQRTLDELAGRWTPDVPDRDLLEQRGVRTFAVERAGHFMTFDNLDGYVEAVVTATVGG